MGGAGGHQHCPDAAPNFPGDSAGFHSFWASQTQECLRAGSEGAQWLGPAPRHGAGGCCVQQAVRLGWGLKQLWLRGWGGLGEAQTAGGAGGVPSRTKAQFSPLVLLGKGRGCLERDAEEGSLH